MDVNFELQRGKYFTIEVGYFDTAFKIKEKVQKYQGIPISHQTLVFNGQVLNDERDVAYYDIYTNSDIQLLIASEFDKSMNNCCNDNEKAVEDKHKKIQLNVKTPTSKIHVPIEMDVHDTVSKLKEKIQAIDQSVPINNCLALHAAGNKLHDYRSLRECELSDNAKIEVSLRSSSTPAANAASPMAISGAGVGSGGRIGSSNKMKLMMLTKCRTKKIALEVNPSDNVGELRNEVWVAPKANELSFAARELFLHL